MPNARDEESFSEALKEFKTALKTAIKSANKMHAIARKHDRRLAAEIERYTITKLENVLLGSATDLGSVESIVSSLPDDAKPY